MEYIIFKENSDDWNFIWDWLASHPINKGIEKPKVALNDNDYSCWMYMGTFKKDDVVISDFKHVNHPTTNNLCKLSVEHKLISEDSIENSNKIK
jgi:hypothetical protein